MSSPRLRIQGWARSRPAGLGRRLLQLYLGLALYGFSDGLLVQAGLGLDPWDVLHQGLARQTGLQIGTWSILVGAAVLMLWIPLRQWPGFGTASNVVVIGLVLNLTLLVLPAPSFMPSRVFMLLAGVFLNGVATGAYIGAGLGPGPRDGLMTGLARRGGSIRVVRTGIEVTVLVVGFGLGGTVGIGTAIYAFGIGPLAHVFIPLFSTTSRGTWQSKPQPAPGRPDHKGPSPEPAAGPRGV